MLQSSTNEKREVVVHGLFHWVRRATKKHLLSEKANEWFSGFLTKEDKIEIADQTGKKVECSPESGEYFYRTVNK